MATSKLNTRLYSDLDLNFITHPLTGDITRKYDNNAISASIRNLIQYYIYEKPFDPDLNSNVKQLLFEHFSPRIAILIDKYTSEIIQKYEPRAEILESTVSPNESDQSYTLTLTYRPKNVLEPVTIKIYLSRVR